MDGPTLITISMIEAAYARAEQDFEAALADRIPPTDRHKARVAQLGGFEVPEVPTVIMLDPLVHTTQMPICEESADGCCCYQYEREQIEAENTSPPKHNKKTLFATSYESRPLPPLNGNREFRLLR